MIRSNASALPGPELGHITETSRGNDVTVREYRKLANGVAHAKLVYFHGGGWVTGDLEYSDAMCRGIAARSKAAVLNVRYRLAPEHRYPAAVNDALSVVRDVLHDRDSGPVVLMGDSAGANLVASVTGQLTEDGGPQPDAQVLVYPLLDDDLTRESYTINDGIVLGRTKVTWFMDHYCPHLSDRRSPRFAPLKSATFRALPRTIVIVAGHDPLRDEGISYAERLEQDGVRVDLIEHPSMVHGFLRQTANSAAAVLATEHVVECALSAMSGTAVPRPPQPARIHWGCSTDANPGERKRRNADGSRG